MTAQSEGRQLCIELATLLDPIVDGRATVVQKWHPAFDKEGLADPLVTIRPAGRRLEKATKGSSNRELTIEIGVIQQLPKPPRSTESDPYNLFDVIDPLDQLAEDLIDVFGPVEDWEANAAAGIVAGQLSVTPILGYLPETVEQPVVLGNQQLHDNRQFLTVIAVTYTTKG